MAVQVPFTTAVGTHGMVIQSGNEVIGSITDWSESQNKSSKDLYEFGNVTLGSDPLGNGAGGRDILGDTGEMFEQMPQNVGGVELSVGRWDLYRKRFETAFANQGIPKLDMLSKQLQAIVLAEFWNTPDNALDFTRLYYGCWFLSLGRNHSAEGDRAVKVSAKVKATRKREV